MTGRERLGALCWVLTAQFFVAQAAAQSAMAVYDPALYDISLLGIRGCGVFADASSGNTDVICAPLHMVFNGGIILHGLLAFCGILLTRRLWPKTRRVDAALWCLAIGCYGAVLVGFYPLDVAIGPHIFGAILALALPGFGLVLLGWAIYAERPIFARVTMLLGLCVLVGALGHALGGPIIGRGTLERLAAWPQTLWYMLAGATALVHVPAQPQSKPPLMSRMA